MLVQRQEAEQEMNHRVEKLMSERQSLQERVNTLQRGLAQIETEKREQEREQIRLEKDKAALQKTLDKVCMFFLQLLWNVFLFPERENYNYWIVFLS